MAGLAPLADIWSFPLWPVSASTVSREVDHLYVYLLAVSGTMIFLIFGLIFYYAIRYRRKYEDEVPRPIRGSLVIEVTWAIVPALFMMVMFGWGAEVYFKNADPPKHALQIYVVGKQWMWKVQHPGGQREINELHVPTGRPVQLILTSQDVIHSFYLPAFRIKKDALPGAYTSEWFQATRPGAYHILCAEYCGTNHSHMIGTVYVMQPSAFEQWLGGAGPRESLVAAGAKLFQRLGCVNCHGNIAPALQGLYMKGVGLADGRVVIADDAYLRESILNPGAKIVAGFPNIMPTFKGLITEQGLLELIAYIKSLGSPAAAATTRAGGGAAGAVGPSIPRERAEEHTFPESDNPHTLQSERSGEIKTLPGQRTGTKGQR